MKLIVKNIEKSFAQKKIIDQISFTVETNQSIAITGSNGSGKTTLIRMLCGLTQADKGSISLEKEGKVINSHQKYMSLVGPYLQMYEELSAFENLQFCAKMINKKIQMSDLYAKIDLVGLKGRAHDLVKTFSSGMKQRLKYAFALVGEPQILFLDEPTSNLDKKGIEIVNAIMRSQKENKILIFATNDDQDLKFADEVVQLGV